MLITIATIIGLIWLLGFALKIGGSLVHILLVIALVIYIYNFLRSRSSKV